jgi:hypothetical protein
MQVMRLGGGLGLLLLTVLPLEAQQLKDRPVRREVDLKEGSDAPDFTIKDIEGKKSVKLSELKGKPIVLIFGSCT